MVNFYYIVLISFSLLLGCSSQPIPQSKCGLSRDLYSSVSRYHRGPINSGYDENHEGTIDHIEAFSSWDFSQLERVLHSGVEHKEYF